MYMTGKKKRIHVQTILLVVIITVLTVCSLLIQMNQNGKKKLEKLSRGFYSENIEKVSIGEAESRNAVKVLSDTLSQGESGLIFKTNLVQGKDIRGVCYRGDVELPVLLRGHFLQNRSALETKCWQLWGKIMNHRLAKMAVLK